MSEMIVAAFNSPSVAQAAIRDLENARIPSADIKTYTKDEPTYQEYRTRQPEHQGGFWSWLIGEEPDPDAGIRGLRYKPRFRAFRCHGDGR